MTFDLPSDDSFSNYSNESSLQLGDIVLGNVGGGGSPLHDSSGSLESAESSGSQNFKMPSFGNTGGRLLGGSSDFFISGSNGSGHGLLPALSPCKVVESVEFEGGEVGAATGDDVSDDDVSISSAEDSGGDCDDEVSISSVGDYSEHEVVTSSLPPSTPGNEAVNAGSPSDESGSPKGVLEFSPLEGPDGKITWVPKRR